MSRSKYKSLVFMISMIAISFAFIGGDCGTESDPPPPSAVAPPTDVNLKVDANPGGGSFAVVSWAHSADQARSDFSHYRVITYQVDENGDVTSIFNEQNDIPKASTTQIVNSISRGIRYLSYVQAILTNGTRSDSVATEVYGGVYYNNDGSIDEFSSNASAESGYGWDPSTGAGTQYSFIAGNLPSIDLHMRRDGGNILFYSPSSQGGTKTTLLSLIGGGEDAFDKTDLEEPNLTSVQVAEDIVYLLKTGENYYIKVWVKSINDVVGVPPYSNVLFDYKVQPIEGLRVVKR